MPKVLVVLAEGFEDIEAVTVVDILRRAGITTVTAALQESHHTVMSAHGIAMRADALFSEASPDEWDVIVLPGGGPGTDRLKASEELLERLRRQKAEGRMIAAICAAPTVLVEAEVLEPGQHITCYPTCSVDLDRPCAGAPVVADGSIITGEAPGSAMLFSLVIVRTLLGDKTAHKLARGLVTDVLL